MSWCGGGEIRPDARRRVAHAGDVGVDLVAGQLAALAGLGALRHLDLDVVGVDQVLGGDAEASRGHLLDRRAHGIAVRQRHEAVGLLAALAGVRAPADAVHGDGERGVRLSGDRAEAHRAGGEAPDDARRPPRPLPAGSGVVRRLQPHQAADGQQPLALLVDAAGERAAYSSGSWPRTACCSLAMLSGVQACSSPRRRQRVGAAHVQHVPVDRRIAVGVGVAAHALGGDLGQAGAFDLGVGAGEVLVDQFRREADGVEDLRAAVGLVGGDAHLGHHLQDALAERLEVVLLDVLGARASSGSARAAAPASRRRGRG